MSRSVSLFPRYDQGENRVTNYCLLMMRLLYEEDPRAFRALLDQLGAIDLENRIGVEFGQQHHTSDGTVDGVISQKSFYTYVETKLSQRFNLGQLERYLENLSKMSGYRILIALGKEGGQHDRIAKDAAAQAQKLDIGFAYWDFESFVKALEDDTVSRLVPHLTDTVAEFRLFLEEENLLSNWRTLLDVVNCAQTADGVKRWESYICPLGTRGYNHKRCRFFGAYGEKAVRLVGEIDAVVVLKPEQKEDEVRFNNCSRSEQMLITEARRKAECWKARDFPAQVFLLNDVKECKCLEKDTKYGLRKNNLAFDLSDLDPFPKSVDDLIKGLQDKKWSHWHFKDPISTAERIFA